MEQKFKHSLPTQNIVLRVQDAKYNEHEYRAGRFYPLVRLHDVTFGTANIMHFSLSVAIDQLLPRVSIVIDDSTQLHNDDNFVKFGDIITIFVGNAIDDVHTPIKNDYYVTRADAINGIYSIEAVLYVPKLFVTVNRVFESKTTAEVLEAIAKECNLGFITNMQKSQDTMHHIQFQPNLQFIEAISHRGYVGANTRTTVFIDQFANLNYVNLTEAISDASNTTTFVTDTEGKKLENDVKFDLSNYEMSTETKARIDSYSSVFNEGAIALTGTSNLDTDIFDIETLQSTKLVASSKHKQLRQISVFTSWSNANVFPEYLLAKQLNTNYNNHIFQNTKLSITLGHFYPQIYMLLHTHCSIYKTVKFSETYSQDETVTLENYDQKVDSSNKSLQKELSNKTGNYMIYGIDWLYAYAEEESRVSQTIQVLKV